MLREMTSSALAHSFKRFAQCAVAGLALAGLAACGGGGSSTPAATTPTTPTTPTPSTPPEIPVTPDGGSISWTVADQCDDNSGVELRFFQYPGQTAQPSRSWPSSPDEVFRASPESITLRCTSGQRVCYGAQSTSFDAEGNPSSVWGVGIDGDRQQDDRYCTTCPASGTERQSSNLTCPRSPSPSSPDYVTFSFGWRMNTNGSWSWAWASGRQTTAVAAETVAMMACEDRLGSSCASTLDAITDGCAAIAISECPSGCQYPAFGISSRRTRQEAETAAIGTCERHTISVNRGTCRVASSDSSRPAVLCAGSAR